MSVKKDRYIFPCQGPRFREVPFGPPFYQFHPPGWIAFGSVPPHDPPSHLLVKGNVVLVFTLWGSFITRRFISYRPYFFPSLNGPDRASRLQFLGRHRVFFFIPVGLLELGCRIMSFPPPFQEESL